MRFYLFSAIFVFGLPLFSNVASGASLLKFPDGWKADTSLFVYHGEEDVLQLTAPGETGEAFLLTNSSAFEDAEWHIGLHLDFNPSSSNYLKLYLATDGEKEFQNGFYLVAGTTKDNICLWERQNGEDQLLIKGAEDRLDNDPAIVMIKVARMKGGHWSLESDTGKGWQTEGNVLSPFGFSVTHFGLSCHFTKTRSDKFYIGPLSVSGDAYSDTVSPVIQKMEVLNGHTLEVLFSEPVAEDVCMPQLFVNSEKAGFRDVSYNQNNTLATIHLGQALATDGDGVLELGGWCDKNGTAMKDTTLEFSYIHPQVTEFYAENHQYILVCFNSDVDEEEVLPGRFQFQNDAFEVETIESVGDNCFRLKLQNKLPDAVEMAVFINDLILAGGDTIPSGPYGVYYHEAAYGDVVISEIMHDPSPPATLPSLEYIELYNRSDYPVDLKSMTLYVNDKSIDLPQHVIFPDEYVVLFRDEGVSFPNGLSLNKWHALNNSGGEIRLHNPAGDVVAALRYPAVLSGKSYKQKGGWSFEIIDTENLSGNHQNWVYCQNDRGGTPGETNSEKGPNPDVIPPGLADAWLENDSVLILDFGEPLASVSNIQKALKSGSPGLVIDSILVDMVFRDQVSICFESSLIPHRIEKIEFLEGITDLAGNGFSGPRQLEFGLPGNIDSLDVVINELLFDPPSFGADYVELYNRSSCIAALDSLCLSRNAQDGEPENLIRLGNRTRWFLPGWHLCFTSNPSWVLDHFVVDNPDRLVFLPALPNYVNDGGTVFLTHPNGKEVDRFDYSPDLHFALLSDTKAAALERTRVNGSTNDPMSWHSASSVANYGTPTSSNSQAIRTDVPKTEKLFTLSPEIFTPDLDGIDDQLIISYSFEKPGKKGSVIIYDAEGRPVRNLVNNQSLGTSGQFAWDGMDDDHRRLPPGIYIVWARVFDTEANVKEYKDSCALGSKRR